ncbi:MAG TPA: DUF192 domain-containing protein [Thermomicrobiales bacterium]|nr:DUF192 domain-containing protein [Thermomicrobiales bacterium]
MTRIRIGRRSVAALVTVAMAVVLGASSLVAAQSTDVPPWRVTPEAPLQRAEIVVGETPLDVELALEGWQQQLGLGYRNGLEPGTGMLFPSDTATPRTFWMKGMRFCLDIVWIDDGVITGAAESVCPDPEGTADADRATFASPGPVTDVLEVPAGWLKEHGYGAGTVVVIPDLPEA